MISVICTKNSSLLSKLIRWTFDEPVSHFVVVLDDRLTFQSNLVGAHLNWLSNFLKKSEIVLRRDLSSLTLEQEEKVYKVLIDLEGKPYDWAAFLFFCWHGFLFKFFKIPMPSANKFNKDGGFLCVEIAKAFEGLVQLPSDLAIVTPFALWKTSFEIK